MGANRLDRRSVPSVGYIVRSYPRLSQTFILDEIRALERLGVPIHIFAMTDPREEVTQAEVAEVRAPVQYLDRLGRTWASAISTHLRAAIRSPRRYAAALRHTIASGESDAGYRVASRYTCFHHAVCLTMRLHQLENSGGGPTGHLHAHFAHDPTLVALLTHLLTGLPYSFTAHARDLYQVPESMLRARAARSETIVTCCLPNVEYLRNVLPPRLHDKVKLLHHGVDLHAFQPRAHRERASDPPLLMSVGRLVEKKGFADLLAACGRLKDAGGRFRCRIYGEGPERSKLKGIVQDLDLGDRITLAGARSRRDLMRAYRQADVFVLTPLVTENGDRDGIPNVLVEALASGLPVVTTAVGGIPELVTHGVAGLVGRPRDVEEIATHLASLLDDHALRRKLGAAGRATVEERFDLRRSAEELAGLFGVVREREPRTTARGLPWRSAR